MTNDVVADDLQVSYGRIAQRIGGDVLRQQICVRPCIDNLMGINPCQRIPNGVPDIVHPTLQASQANFGKTLQDFWHIRQHLLRT